MHDPKLEQLVPPDLEKDWSVRMTLRLGRATSHFAQAVSHDRNWVPEKFLEGLCTKSVRVHQEQHTIAFACCGTEIGRLDLLYVDQEKILDAGYRLLEIA